MKKILVIEDEIGLLDSISGLLTDFGYECAGALNGADGLRMARSFLPDLIVSDVMMPQLDGYGVLKTLRRDSETALIPFIFLSGRQEIEDLRRGMSLGADDYLLKPFSSDELLTAVALRLEKQEQIYRAASGKNQELKDFLSNALPHELRTPLAPIVGYLELLQADFMSFSRDEVQNIVQQMSAAAGRLYRLVENHILYTQLTMTQQDRALSDRLRELAECDSPAMSIKLVAQKQAVVHNRMQDLIFDGFDEATLQLFRENLEKIIEELVDNAFKFSPPGTAVIIQAKSVAESFEITISDTGRGMSPRQIAAVGAHQQFGRAQYEQQGVGLGLSIAKQTCRVFGGSLRLAPNTNGGITATAVLPSKGSLNQGRKDANCAAAFVERL